MRIGLGFLPELLVAIFLRKIKSLYEGIADEEINTLCTEEWEFLQFFEVESEGESEKCVLNLVVSYKYEKRIPFYQNRNKNKINKLIIYHHDEYNMKKYLYTKLRSSEKRKNEEVTSNI